MASDKRKLHEHAFFLCASLSMHLKFRSKLTFPNLIQLVSRGIRVCFKDFLDGARMICAVR